jgi:microcystin-dependent protein
MSDFKSDTTSTSLSDYASIPTGGIVQIAGPFSKYSVSQYETLGLLPCDGRSLNASSNTKFLNLYNVIGTLYGGSGSSSFNIPNLKTNKVSIVATSNTFYSNNTVGTLVTTVNHSHSTSANNNSYSMNAGNIDHDHNVNNGGLGNMVSDTAHGHSGSGSGSIGPNVNKNGPAGASGGGLNGNHSHNVNVNSNNADGGSNDHLHGASNHNIGYVVGGAVSHTHGASVTTAGNTSTASVTSSSLEIPYANMLYFIRI